MVPITEFRLVTKADAAGVFGVCMKTIDNYIKEGLLPRPVQFASKEYWHPGDFQAFIEMTFRRTSGDSSPTGAPAIAEHVEGQPVAQRPAKAIAARENHPVARARARGAAIEDRLNAGG